MPPTSLTTFMNVPFAQRGAEGAADVVVQGIPFDLGTTNRPGTRFGPDAIRIASKILQWEPQRWPWRYNFADRLTVVDVGDIEFAYGHVAGMAETTTAATAQLLRAGHRVLSLGGDHYVTLPLLRAFHAVHGPIPILHFDAHTDTDVAAHDHHGVMFRVAADEGLIDVAHSLQVGIRTWYDPPTHLFEVADADWVNHHGPAATLARIAARLGDRPFYLTIDIDCLDPAFAPGTGTPVAGGLTSNALLQIIRGLGGRPILGADVVEVSPPYDHAELTALAGATVALDILHVLAAQSVAG
jgi:agmatinase